MFYKKSISLFVTLVLLLCAVLMGGQVFSVKANTADAEDTYFLDFVREDTDLEEISYTRIELHDQTLTPNGRQYTFSVGGVQGYALTHRITIDEQCFYEVEELFYNVPAPFQNYQGTPVYVTFKTYLDCVDGEFYDLSNNRAVVSNEVVADLANKGFGYMQGEATFTTNTETINYSTKDTQSYGFPYDAPNLLGGVEGSCCANVAGTVIIAYYDRFYENLMPNYQSYDLVFGRYIRYKDSSAEISSLVGTMIDYMSVEGVTQGTTFTGFNQGMQRYVDEQGYTYSTTSLMSWGSLNFDSYVQTVSQEIPVAIFLNTFTMLNGITEGTNVDTVSSGYCTGTHVEVGIGYKVDTYYDANGSVITTRRYLKVISGLSNYGMGYLNINGSGEIVNAIAINIS